MNQILLGDCLDVLKTLPGESVHSVVTDPPYGLGTREPSADEIVAYLQGGELDTYGDFMGRDWSIPPVAVWRECFRVLKPGGHLLSFGGTRTFDLISIGIRAAGFECRDTVASQFGVQCLQWVQGQGFPKALAVQRALEKAGLSHEEAEQWSGWATAIKPSWEPILVFRKPLAESTVAKQVLATGTGAMNIDACRVRFRSTEDKASAFPGGVLTSRDVTGGGLGAGIKDCERKVFEADRPAGRWPANLLLSHSSECKITGSKKVPAPVINRFDDGMKPFGDGAGHKYTSEQTGDADGMEEVPVYECEVGCPVKTLDEQSGVSTSLGGKSWGKFAGAVPYEDQFSGLNPGATAGGFGDTGGASRFFSQFEPDAADVPVYECADGCPVKELDEQSGMLVSKWGRTTARHSENNSMFGMGVGLPDSINKYVGEVGGASRYFSQFEPNAPFFYSGKVSKAERDRGLPKGTNKHPTVKPLAVMRWLVKLVTPKGGTILDPYCGSGTTCLAALEEGCQFIGIERDPESHQVAVLRTTREPDLFDEIGALE